MNREHQGFLGSVALRGYLVLADISGFTRFLDTTELQHARTIISRLLQGLLDANTLPFKVSKLEGDAIFFYTTDCTTPSSEQVLDQLNRLYGAFHHTRTEVGDSLDCSCQCCSQVGKLQLKFSVHAGEFAEEPIGPFCELVGLDVIVVHRLLKNAVPLREYMLFTNVFLELAPPSFARLLSPLTVDCEGIGPVLAGYCPLGNGPK